MVIPLLNYNPTCRNHRVTGYELPSDEQPRIYTTENPLSPTEMDVLIEAAYRQIFFYAFKREWEPFLESQLRNGQITVRDFIRGLLLSDTYKRTFYGFNSNYRFVEQCVQRVLGRDVYGEAEKISWSIIVGSKGLEAFIDALLDSEEYLDNFGFDTVPYQRRRVLPGRDRGEIPFNIQSPRYDSYYRKVFGFPSGTWTGVVRRYVPQEKKPKVGDPALYMDMVRSLKRRAITGSPTSASNIDMSKVPYRRGVEAQIGGDASSPVTSSPVYTSSSQDLTKKKLIQSPPPLLRYPYLDCQESSPINQRFSLYVEMRIESPPELEIKAMEIEDTGIPEKLPEVEIVLIARGFDIKENDTRIIQVERDKDTKERFVLIPRQLGEQQISVDFYQNNRYKGTIKRNIMIYEREESRTIEVSQPKVPTLEFSNKSSVSPPDLELRIRLDQNNNGTLNFSLRGNSRGISYYETHVGQKTLITSPKEKMKSIYDKLSNFAKQLSRTGTPVDLNSSASNSQDDQRIADELASVGHELWEELIPDKLKQEYWKFKSNVKSLLIASDEPWIPWEMIKPYDKVTREKDPFWCEQFAMSRWLCGNGLADELSTELVVTVAPDISNLPNVEREVDFLQNLKKLNANSSSFETIRNGRYLKKYIQDNSFSILHFACHRMFNSDLPNDSAIQLTGDSFSPSDILFMFKEVHPIIFINACHSGLVGFSFTKIGGWADKFVEHGAGVFIGAMWQVNDELAFQFAQTFYTALLKDNLTVAQAFQKSRQAIREAAPNNSTWLAYSLYADPEARIIQQAS